MLPKLIRTNHITEHVMLSSRAACFQLDIPKIYIRTVKVVTSHPGFFQLHVHKVVDDLTCEINHHESTLLTHLNFIHWLQNLDYHRKTSPPWAQASVAVGSHFSTSASSVAKPAVSQGSCRPSQNGNVPAPFQLAHLGEAGVPRLQHDSRSAGSGTGWQWRQLHLSCEPGSSVAMEMEETAAIDYIILHPGVENGGFFHLKDLVLIGPITSNFV